MPRPRKYDKVDKNLKRCVVPYCPTKALNGMYKFPNAEPTLKKRWIDVSDICTYTSDTMKM